MILDSLLWIYGVGLIGLACFARLGVIKFLVEILMGLLILLGCLS
jgi:hypothetical protein